jgi:hypothetical protein
MKPFPFNPIIRKDLTKSERKEARIRIDRYYQNKLKELQKYVYEAFERQYAGKLSVSELDHVIYIYRKQSKELFSFVYRSDSNKDLPIILAFIDVEEKGEWEWQPDIKQEI